jgi:hypothetical protein
MYPGLVTWGLGFCVKPGVQSAVHVRKCNETLTASSTSAWKQQQAQSTRAAATLSAL